jgi:hypothetical protein
VAHETSRFCASLSVEVAQKALGPAHQSAARKDSSLKTWQSDQWKLGGSTTWVFKFKTPSGIIGNVTTYEHNGKQYVAVLSGVSGWAGIGLAAGLTEPTAGLGAVGGYAGLRDYTSLGGQLTVFALPSD